MLSRNFGEMNDKSPGASNTGDEGHLVFFRFVFDIPLYRKSSADILLNFLVILLNR